jgi:hypothetical protein
MVLTGIIGAFKDDDFEANIFLAIQFAESKKDAILTIDEVGAIHLYTQETPLYVLINALMRQRARTLLKPFFSYIKLLLKGLYKLSLPDAPETVYRGVKLNLASKYAKDAKVVWWSFSSTTASVGVLQNAQFLGQTGDRTMFHITSRRLVDIRAYSAYASIEDERLLLPGAYLKVTDVLDAGNGLRIVQLKDEPSPALLDFSHPQLSVGECVRLFVVFAG